jgi:hypothetical protein
VFCAAIWCSSPIVLQVLGYVYLCLKVQLPEIRVVLTARIFYFFDADVFSPFRSSFMLLNIGSQPLNCNKVRVDLMWVEYNRDPSFNFYSQERTTQDKDLLLFDSMFFRTTAKMVQNFLLAKV